MLELIRNFLVRGSKISFPTRLKATHLNTFPKPMLKEVRRFSDFFENFFIEFLLDIKSVNDVSDY